MKKNIHVAQYIDSFYPNVDGVVNTVNNYATIINEHQDNCSLVVTPNYPGHNDKLPYKVIRTSSIQFFGFKFRIPIMRYKRGTRKIITEANLNIIHAHSPFILGHLALKEARKRHIPIVTTFHSKYKDDFYQVSHSKILTKMMMRYIMNFYKKVDSVWACSKSTANTLREYGFKGHIEVMENGTEYVYPANADELAESVINTYHIKKNINTILFVGTFIWQKNLKLVIDTIEELSKHNFEFQMVFVGNGNNNQQIRKYAKTKKIDEKMIFTDRVIDIDVMKGLYKCADLFFFPSIYDNAPLVLREAAVMKVPALLVANSNSSEVIVPNINGFVAENTCEAMAEKIIEVFKDKENMKKVGLEASLTIPISWNEIVNRVEEKYSQIIEEYNNKYKR